MFINYLLKYFMELNLNIQVYIILISLNVKLIN